MNNKKLIIPIRGMHCKSCEILIEEELKNVQGVRKSEADYRKSQVVIYCEDEGDPKPDSIAEAVGKAGYTVGDPEKKDLFVSKNKKDYKELGFAFLILVGLYFFLKGLGLTDIGSINIKDNVLTAPVALFIGLVAGVSTCMALIGGLVLGVSARHNEMHPEATSVQKFRPHIFFNLGRFLSYTFLGGLLGVLGSAFQLSSTALGLITIAIGVLMFIMGIQLIEIFPWANKLKFTLPKGMAKMIGISGHKKEYSHNNSVILGALTFFLPCGFTQAMQVYAISTGNFVGGASIMGAFALGTMPGLLGIGGLSSVIKGNAAKQFFKVAGLAIIMFSFFNISNGWGLAGFSFPTGENSNIAVNDPNVTIENGIQIVSMKEVAGGYEPNSFTIRKGIPVKWVIDAQAPYSCASSLVLPKYNVRKNLKLGENIIEFTPNETGKIKFSCSMGMYTGVFNVIDKDASASPSSSDISSDSQVASTAGPSCGGGGCGCGGARQNITQSEGDTQSANTGTAKTQVINSVFTVGSDVQPNTFRVKSGVPVEYTIDVKEDGIGCMSAVKIQGLSNSPIELLEGKKIVMKFTPQSKGEYPITCAMGMKRGKIIVE